MLATKTLENLCNIGKKRPEGESSKQDKLESEEERRKSEPRAACNKPALQEKIAEEGPVTCRGGCNMPGRL